jgi:hypothetical protein
MTQTEAIRAGMERWAYAVAHYHINEWATERQDLLAYLRADWQEYAQPPDSMEEVAEWTRVLRCVNEAREGEDVTLHPEVPRISSARIEIDTSDADMGGRWTEVLAALDARLSTLTHETQGYG